MIHIRRAQPGDIALAARLEGLIDAGTRWEEEQGQRFLANNDNALFLAELDGGTIGFATAHRLQRLDQRRAEVLLYDIAVEDAHHRQGAGRALMAHVTAWAREVGADELWVLADADDTRACAFYAATGGVQFTPDSTMFTYRLADS